MSERLVAKRYAEALFQVSKEKKLLDKIEQDLNLIINVFADTKELMTFLRHPQIDENVKKEIIESSFKTSINDLTKSFLFQLIDSKRIENFEEISQYYLKLSNEARGIVNVEAISSSALSGAEEKKVIDQLTKQLNKEVRLNNIIDPSILGGMVIKIGDRVYDGSINKQLKALKRSLAASRV